MNPRRILLSLIAAALAAASGFAQETGRVLPLRFRVLDLTSRTSAAAGKIEAMKVRETPTEVRIDLSADVLFEFDKADLLPAAEQTLARAAAVIRDRGQGVVRIEGHTDAKGDDAYNQRLSQRRADSVRRWLVEKGSVGGVRFEVSGLGETRPVAPNEKADGSDDPDGRQKNRRVEIVIRKG